MGRSKKNKYRNKNRKNRKGNNNLSSQKKAKEFSSISGTTTMKFLKRDGNVGLFVDDDGIKHRVHSEHIYGTLGWITKGTNMAVRANYAIPVTNKRLLVTNCPDWFMNGEDRNENILEGQTVTTPYVFEDDVRVVDGNVDAIRMKLPIGTQYHWISFVELPKIGDYVMGSLAGNAAGIMGYVEEVNEFMETCVIKGIEHSIMDIGYRILNPQYVHGQKTLEFIN